MPLSINVGLSRKASRDYQSTGVSINVTAELDQSLLAKPDALQAEMSHLYVQAEQALERQIGCMGEPGPDRNSARNNGGYSRSNGNGNRNGGNGYRRTNGNGNGSGQNNGGIATQSQRRAIDAISRRLSIDPALEAHDVIGTELDDLTVRQASELIDHLKSIQPAGNGR